MRVSIRVNGMPIWAQLSHNDATAQTDFIARDLVADGDELVAADIVDEDINDSLRFATQYYPPSKNRLGRKYPLDKTI